jgi:hypothetical protein
MTFEQFVKKNAKRITRLETELDKLFVGMDDVHTAVSVQQDIFSSCRPDPRFTIGAYISQACKWYYLKNFTNMTAMITQIKHDVKEARK